MRGILRTIGTVLVGVVLGAGTVKPVTLLVARHLAIHDGVWQTFPGTGSRNANPYTRAAVALVGLYALSSREAIYYTAFTDGSGHALRGECDYSVVGKAPAARWWSVTLYGADSYLVPNGRHRYSWNAGSLKVRRDGKFLIRVSSLPKPGNWLPAPPKGRFSLTLRLYRPDDAVREHPATAALPRLVTRDCR